MKKYEFVTDKARIFLGKELHRIRALESFGDVKKGDLDGWIEKEENLSLDLSNTSWVYDDAMVYDDAKIIENAVVCDYATVCENAIICGDAMVFGNALVAGCSYITHKAKIYEDAEILGYMEVYGKSKIHGNVRIKGYEEVYANADIKKSQDFLSICNIGSRNDCTTFFRCADGKVRVKCGCFRGCLEEFADKVWDTHQDSKNGKVYKQAIEMAKTWILG